MMGGESSLSEKYLDFLVRKYTTASCDTVEVDNAEMAEERSALELVIAHASRLAATTHDYICPPFVHLVGVGGDGDFVSSHGSMFKVGSLPSTWRYGCTCVWEGWSPPSLRMEEREWW